MDLTIHFSRKYIQMIKRYVKKCSMSQKKKEMAEDYLNFSGEKGTRRETARFTFFATHLRSLTDLKAFALSPVKSENLALMI